MIHFNEPPMKYRPRMRWWIPGNMVDDTEMIAEIHDMKAAGFLGAEICPMPSKLDRWGNERWYEVLRNVLKEAARISFEIDLTMTPGWPLALPTITDVADPEQGSLLELDGAWVDGITREQPFTGILPVSQEAVADAALVSGKIELYAVTIAKYVDKEKKLLSFESARTLPLHEILTTVHDETTCSASFFPTEEGEYVLFAWWLHSAGRKTGAYHQIDHLGRAGARKLIDYYEAEVFPALGEYKSHLTSFFIDSLEYETHLDYTPGFFEAFCEKYGYHFLPYLPAVYDQDNGGCFLEPKPDFSFDQYNTQLKNTYAEFLTQFYIENHLKPLTAFAEKHGIALRYQTAYGKTMELAHTAAHVSIPETETLYGNDFIDFYRIQSGTQHILGKDLYSIESAAVWKGRCNGDENSGNYEQGFQDQLFHMQRAYYGGVNLAIYHGYNYRGHFHGAGNENGILKDIQWPGYHSMGASGPSNSWGERQPNWIAANDINAFLTRNQYVLRQGTPKIDLAVYYHQYFEKIDNGGAEIRFDPGELENHGYNYDLVSPSLFGHLSLSSDGRVLNPEGPSYKALIFDNQKEIPVKIRKAIFEWSDRGFPIFFIGCLPTEDAFYQPGSKLDTAVALSEKKIYFCKDRNDLLHKLREANVLPSIRYSTPVPVWNTYRKDDHADYFYLYHHAFAEKLADFSDKQPVTFELTVPALGTPYLLDAWTGNKHQPVYNLANGELHISMDLCPNESTILLLDHKEALAPSCTASKSSCIQSVELTNWQLTLESWIEGTSPVETQKIQSHHTLYRPVFWTSLPGMEYVSGIGTYETTFRLNELTDQKYLFRIDGIVEDIFLLEINGQRLPVNQIRKQADISKLLKTGENTIRLIVGSTLLNALLLNEKQHGILNNSGQPDNRKLKENGMNGSVYIDIF